MVFPAIRACPWAFPALRVPLTQFSQQGNSFFGKSARRAAARQDKGYKRPSTRARLIAESAAIYAMKATTTFAARAAAAVTTRKTFRNRTRARNRCLTSAFSAAACSNRTRDAMLP